MGYDIIWEMDAEDVVEQMGDYDGAGPASQNTDYVHMDRGLPH
jgi:hypothetical protein